MEYIDYIIIGLLIFATLSGFIFGLRSKVIKKFTLLIALIISFVLSGTTANYLENQGVILMIQTQLAVDIPYKEIVIPIIIGLFITVIITMVGNYLLNNVIIKQKLYIGNRVLGMLGSIINFAILLLIISVSFVYVSSEIVYFSSIFEAIKALPIAGRLIQVSLYIIELIKHIRGI